MELLFTLVLSVFLLFLWYHSCIFLVYHLWRPKVLHKIMSTQGIIGPPQPFLPKTWDRPDIMHITHDIVAHVIPFNADRLRRYGTVAMNWFSAEPRMDLADMDLMRKVLIKSPENFGKSPLFSRAADDAIADGVFEANGQSWLEQRHLLVPAFHAEKIKGMTRVMYANSQTLLHRWERLVLENGGKKSFDVYPEFVELTACIIGETGFGANNSTSKHIVGLLRKLLALQIEQARYALLANPIRFLPIPINFQRWKLKREIHQLLRAEMDARRCLKREIGSASHGSDLLGTLLDSNWDDHLIITECKTFYTTGHLSLSTLYTWLMMLLAINPEWQEKARAEVDAVASEGPINNAQALKKLKLVEMIILETLRLYPPIPLIPRVALKDTYAGHLFMPKGLGVTLHVIMAHHSPELWGDDVHEFKPERFAKGGAAASKHPMGFMPFSFGNRVCIGQAYSLFQAKIVVAALLKRFRWSLSPDYRHNPVLIGSMFPKHGLPIILKLVSDK